MRFLAVIRFVGNPNPQMGKIQMTALRSLNAANKVFCSRVLPGSKLHEDFM